MKTTDYSRSRMRGKLSSTVLKTSTGGDACAEFIQGANKKEARRILTAKVHDGLYAQQDKDYSDFRKRQIDGGGRGNKVRTYNFLESRVVDHRLELKTSQVKKVLAGEFDILFNSTK